MNNKELSKKLLSLGQELINLSLELDSNKTTNTASNNNPKSSSSSIKTYVWAKKNKFEARYKLPNSTSVKYVGKFDTREEAEKALSSLVQKLSKKVAKA